MDNSEANAMMEAEAKAIRAAFTQPEAINAAIQAKYDVFTQIRRAVAAVKAAEIEFAEAAEAVKAAEERCIKAAESIAAVRVANAEKIKAAKASGNFEVIQAAKDQVAKIEETEATKDIKAAKDLTLANYRHETAKKYLDSVKAAKDKVIDANECLFEPLQYDD